MARSTSLRPSTSRPCWPLRPPGIEDLYRRLLHGWAKDKAIAEAAKDGLFDLHELGIGKQAPEISGKDGSGKAFKLSDYRGKVVVLEFWTISDWIWFSTLERKRQLVKRLQGQPFALLGASWYGADAGN